MIIRLELKRVLSRQISKEIPMFPLSRIQLLKFAAGGLVVISTLGPPARADELAQSLGPVGPHEPILTTVGSQRVIAFYMPGSDRCALHAVVWDHTVATLAGQPHAFELA